VVFLHSYPTNRPSQLVVARAPTSDPWPVVEPVSPRTVEDDCYGAAMPFDDTIDRVIRLVRVRSFDVRLSCHSFDD
jgi:hypothetical protein